MKKTILCVDDTPANLFTLRSVLESSASELYDVVSVESAHDGLEVLLRQKVDIILLDVMMPEIDGYEAARMIKSNKKTKNIPIIFLTAKKDDNSIEQCYASGGDDYVNKPFNNIELLARISFHLRLKEKGKLLLQEKEYAQNIIDLQENMILVTDGKMAQNVNSALLDFYKFDSLKEFQSKRKCICYGFVKEDGYFHLDLIKENALWVEEVIELSKKEDVLIKLAQDKYKNVFTLNAVAFNSQYIVTLTDITHISQLSQEYEHEANVDALTQAYNRNMFHRLMNKKITQAKQKGTSFVFVLLDIDFFKKVNDTHGHLVGDNVLKNMSALIKKHIRDGDIFARWGGEEFALTFNTGMDNGFQIANNLRGYVESEEFDAVKRITCSFGITKFRREDTLESLTKRADLALYEAKETGRNRVCKA
ncbi:MAG: diguanylate cyclase response regulator [Epsilonproteobacteria bacterium]|nr:MAG: diguanylate cyclase response regulator [Campylobacterota bacterium]